LTLIESIRTYLLTFSSLESGGLVNVDHLGQTPGEYSIIPLPGERIVESYIDGGSSREYPFAFQAVVSTSDNAERMDTNGFYEALADWFETQTESGVLPTLSAKKTATSIETTSWGYLFEEGQSDTGIYQVTCKLTYEQQP